MPQPRIELPMDAIRSICQEHQIHELAAFGSSLRDDSNPDSRVDFLVEFEGEAGIELTDLLALQDQLAAALGRKVNLVPKAGLRPQIRDHATSQAVVIYRA